MVFEWSALNVFALILAFWVLIKTVVVLSSPKSWLNFAKKLWKQPAVTGVVLFVLSAIVLYYLLMQLTIIQIFAVMLFFALLSGATMAPYTKEFLSMAQKLLKRSTLRQVWYIWLIWLALVVWVLWALFA